MSKLGNGSFAQPLKLTAGGVNYSKLTAEQQKALDNYVRGLGVPPGPPTQQGIYATPEFTGDPYPREVLKPVEENQEPPEGWPRNPIFNAPGDVPGPPVQFGPPVEPTTVKPGEGFTGIGLPENDIFYFHPDHLGSTSYITTRNGSISQHVEYIAFGEVLFEEHSSSFSSPYLFNGKELDRETNLSYYGARYLDMKTSLWLNVDPLALYNPIFENEFYFDGQHNGGIYYSGNLSPYSYCYQNPIKYIDPNGKQANSSVLLKANFKTIYTRSGLPIKHQYGYKFTEGTAHLLSLVSNVSEKNISNTKLNFQHTPVGGGALTEGPSSNNATINIFWNEAPKGSIYNTNTKWMDGFLGLMAHEVGHIPQIDEAGGNISHLAGSLGEYINNWLHLNDSHDSTYAHKENAAEKGSIEFTNFNEFINNNYGKNKLSKLFNNKNNTQKDIIERLDKWWNNYQKQKSKNE